MESFSGQGRVDRRAQDRFVDVDTVGYDAVLQSSLETRTIRKGQTRSCEVDNEVSSHPASRVGDDEPPNDVSERWVPPADRVSLIHDLNIPLKSLNFLPI